MYIYEVFISLIKCDSKCHCQYIKMTDKKEAIFQPFKWFHSFTSQMWICCGCLFSKCLFWSCRSLLITFILSEVKTQCDCCQIEIGYQVFCLSVTTSENGHRLRGPPGVSLHVRQKCFTTFCRGEKKQSEKKRRGLDGHLASNVSIFTAPLTEKKGDCLTFSFTFQQFPSSSRETNLSFFCTTQQLAPKPRLYRMHALVHLTSSLSACHSTCYFLPISLSFFLFLSLTRSSLLLYLALSPFSHSWCKLPTVLAISACIWFSVPKTNRALQSLETKGLMY